MISYFLEGVDQSTNVSEATLNCTNQLQQRSDQARFEMRNTKPVVDDTVNIYFTDKVSSSSSATVVLQGLFEPNTNIFYIGQEIWLRPQTATEEKAVVLSFNESTLTLTLEAAPTVALVNGDLIGQMVFAGFIAVVQDKNLQTLQNLLWDVTVVDFSKLFDAKVVTNSWVNKDGRYMINDFVNQYVNYNATLDTMYYTGTAVLTANQVLQAVWHGITGDATLPTQDTVNFIEGSAGAKFAWTNSGGAASWSATLVAVDVSDMVGASHGQPNAGQLMIWPDFTDVTKVTSLKIRIGSSVSNYIEVPFTIPTISSDFVYTSALLDTITPVGDPNWRSVTYAQIYVNETATGSMTLNGLRVNSNSAFTLRQVSKTIAAADYRASQVKASELMNRLAQAYQFAWFVDYDQDLFFNPIETLPAPFSITDTSNNFTNLRITTDVSNLGNRIIVNGGLAPSVSRYAQVFPTNSIAREWALQAGPSSLTVLIDDGLSTQAAVVGTNSTTVVLGHTSTFVAGDNFVNVTRGNVIGEILTVVSTSTFTVTTIPNQTATDVISFFELSKTAGQEGTDVEASFDYMYSGTKQSVRSSSQTGILLTGQFIRFSYFQLDPILVQYADGVSVSALKALGLGNGVFDLAPIVDSTITDSTTALLTAQAQVSQFSNAVINGTFTTIQKGLRAGQILTINQATQRNFNNNYLVQKVDFKQRGGRYQDYIEYTVTFGTTLFGFIELMQKALRKQNTFGADTTNQSITLIVSGDEDAIASDVNTVALDGINKVTNTETPVASDSNIVVISSPQWEWEPSSGQTLPTRWNLFEYS